MTRTIFTLGYAGSSLAEIDEISKRLDAVVIDTRYSTRSRNPSFSAKRLAAVLGERYVRMPEFGNVNYKNGGEIRLADAEAGKRKAIPLLQRASVILLCVCSSPLDCHRSTVAEMLSGATTLPVIHLTPNESVPRSLATTIPSP